MTDTTTTLIRYVGDDWTLPFIHTDKLNTPIALIDKTPIIFLTPPNDGVISELNINNGGVTVLNQNDPATKGRFIVFVSRTLTQTFIEEALVAKGPYIGNLNKSYAKLRIVMEDGNGRRKTLESLHIICEEV